MNVRCHPRKSTVFSIAVPLGVAGATDRISVAVPPAAKVATAPRISWKSWWVPQLDAECRAGAGPRRRIGQGCHRPPQELAARLATLTTHQRAVMDRIIAGDMSKNITADLNISQRTVEHHRAAVMQRTGAKNLAELIRLVVTRKRA